MWTAAFVGDTQQFPYFICTLRHGAASQPLNNLDKLECKSNMPAVPEHNLCSPKPLFICLYVYTTGFYEVSTMVVSIKTNPLGVAYMLNIWSLVGRTIWGELGGMALEEVCHWSLRFPKTSTIPSMPSLLPICELRCELSAATTATCLPATMYNLCGSTLLCACHV